MILEVAILLIRNGEEKQFERDFMIAGQYISSIEGYRDHTLRKCMEQDNKYLLLVEWERIEDHVIGFRQSEQYSAWKKLLHHYYDPMPLVEHYELITSK